MIIYHVVFLHTDQNRKDQLWEVGVANDEGYFTLTHWKTKKVLTAISSNQLEVRGNLWKMKIRQNWMHTVKSRSVDWSTIQFWILLVKGHST